MQKIREKNDQKVCIITATYPIGAGYGGIFVADHAKMLSSVGYDVTVLFAEPVRKTKKTSIIHYNIDNIDVYRKGFFCVAATYTVPMLRHNITKCCDSLFSDYITKKGLPDIIISHFTYPAGVGASFISRKYGVPFIAVEHLSLLLHPNKRPWINRSIRAAIEQASAVICVSKGLLKGLQKRIRIETECYVIPNPIDNRFTYHLRASKTPFVFLSVGSLRAIKNYALLIRVFALSFKGKAGVELHIVGSGPLKRDLDSLVKKEGIRNQVHFLGELTREQLKNAYAASDCFILLSRNETFGVAYREAMATGLPIISSDNYGIRNSWEEGFGIIVDIDNKKTIIDAMKALYEGASFDHVYIAQRMHELYSFDKVGKEYHAIIHKIIVNQSDCK